MRALFLPLIGATSNVPSESNFASFRALWRQARVQWPQFYGYVAVPASQLKQVDAALTDDERAYLSLIAEDIPASFHVQEITLAPTLIQQFNRYLGTQWVDLVLTSRLPLGHYLRVGLQDWRTMAGCPTVALYEPGVNQDLFEDSATIDTIRLAKTLSVASCPTQFLSTEERDLLWGWARRHGSAQTVHQVMTHSKVIHPILTRVAPDPTSAPSRHVLFFGGRLSGAKCVPFILDLYTAAFGLGLPVHIVVTCPSAVKPHIHKLVTSKGRGADGQPLIRLIPKCDRETFHREAGAATIGLVASKYEGYPYGFLEMAVSGQLTLFPDTPWARAVLPPDYPWIYHGEAEALTLVKRALTWEWLPMVRQQLASLRPFHGQVSLTYEAQRWGWWTDPRWQAEMTPIRRAPAWIRDSLESFASTVDTFTLAEACRAITAASRAFSARAWDAPPARFWCRPGVHAELQALGFVDTCLGPEPQYERSAAEAEEGDEDVTETATVDGR